jgi:hypothetical protein
MLRNALAMAGESVGTVELSEKLSLSLPAIRNIARAGRDEGWAKIFYLGRKQFIALTHRAGG